MNQVIIESANNWRLVGELSFITVGDLLIELTSKISNLNTKELVIDLKEVTVTDSAGLALLIELLRTNVSISFYNIPERILNLSAVAGVKNLLINKGD